MMYARSMGGDHMWKNDLVTPYLPAVSLGLVVLGHHTASADTDDMGMEVEVPRVVPEELDQELAH